MDPGWLRRRGKTSDFRLPVSCLLRMYVYVVSYRVVSYQTVPYRTRPCRVVSVVSVSGASLAQDNAV